MDASDRPPIDAVSTPPSTPVNSQHRVVQSPLLKPVTYKYPRLAYSMPVQDPQETWLCRNPLELGLRFWD